MKVTPKQKAIVELVKEGLTNPQIAERLGNTEGSIEQHLVKIFRACNVKSRQELAEKADQVEVRDSRRIYVR